MQSQACKFKCDLVQVLSLIPVSHFLASLYAAQPALCNMLLDAVFSLAAALFAFVILPAGDFIIGQEPPEAVSTHVTCNNAH
jgi:hypothetical protein